MKGAVFFQLFSLSQWATPFCFMISFCCSLHIQSCLLRVPSHISQKNFKDDLWTFDKDKTHWGHLTWKTHTPSYLHPFLLIPTLILHFPSICPLKYLPEKLWLMCLRPSVSFAPIPSQFPVYVTYWSSLWCVVHRLSFEGQWSGESWESLRAKTSEVSTTQQQFTYWPSMGKAPHLAQWRPWRRTWALNSVQVPTRPLTCSVTRSKSFTVLAHQFPHLSNVGTQTRDLSSPLQFSYCKRQGCHGILPLYLASWNFPGLLNGREKKSLGQPHVQSA